MTEFSGVWAYSPWNDFLKGLLATNNAQVALSPFRANLFCALDKSKRPDTWVALQALPGIDMVRATVAVDAASCDSYVTSGRNIPIGLLIFLAILSGGITCLIDREIPEMILIKWSVLMVGIVVFAANTICVYYMERYTLPVFVSAVFALLIAVASLARRRAG